MIRYVFVHLDGVVLENILAPVIFSLIRKLGGSYSAGLENNILSRSQDYAAAYLIQQLNLQLSVEQVIQLYRDEREAYIVGNRIGQKKGLEHFLKRLTTNGYRVLAYGGADRDYFLENTGNVRNYFADDGYVQTRDIRPGVKEIIQDIFHIDFEEALFIDETIAVAEAARQHNVPFIGISNGHTFSFQRREMELMGVKYLVKSLSDIDLPLLNEIQQVTLSGSFWK